MLGIATMVSAGAVAATAGSASAHTGDLFATAVCNSQTGEYDITYTLQISQTDLEGSTKWKVGTTTFEGTPNSNAGLDRGPVRSTGTGTIVLGQHSVPGTSTKAPWAYAYTIWSDNFSKGSDGGDIALAGTCAPSKHVQAPTPGATVPDCDTAGRLILPVIEGIVWTGAADGDGPGSYTVTASAKPEYVLDGQSVFQVTVLPKITGAQCAPAPAKVVAPAPTWVDECGPDNGHWVFQDTHEYEYTERVNKNGSKTITATPKSGYVFDAGAKVQWTKKDSGELCATNRVCALPAAGDTSTNLHPTWADVDTRSAGHSQYVDGGLHLWTDDASSEAKVAQARAVAFDLKDTGAVGIDYTAAQGIEPGVQLYVNFDGTHSGTLVYESTYGQDLWLTNGSSSVVKGKAPVVGGGNGSQWHGTIDQWLAEFPDAKVTGIGFSLGSGVHADGVLHSITVGCTTYLFDHVKPSTPPVGVVPPVTPPSPPVVTPPVTTPVTPIPPVVEGVKVTAPPSPPATPAVTPVVKGVKHEAAGPALAYTGFEAGRYGVAGLLLLMAGSGLVVVARQRSIKG